MLDESLLNIYYQDDQSRAKKIYEIVNNQSKISSRISLRILDYFVTVYSKQQNVNYDIDGKNFIVHDDYRIQRKLFTPKHFNLFRRGCQFYFDCLNGCLILTTVGQLNFFRWAISNKVIEYVEDNYDDIYKSMVGYKK